MRISISALPLNRIIGKPGLFSVVVRNYYNSTENFSFSENFKKEVAKKLDPIAEEFFEHRALKHPLFAYLSEQSSEGFTAKQFLIYRDNFFRRTQLTIPSIALTVKAAVTYGDFDAAALAFRNLKDEMADGDTKNIHSRLLLESHNIHGMRTFAINPVDKMTDVEKSNVLIPEVEEYRKAKEEIFTKPYPFVAGNTWAHELAADSMLDHFRKSFFTPYLGLYSEKESAHVMRFFNVHKDDSREGGNIEQQHEKMAREAVESACVESLNNVEQVREGGLIFLSHQEKLWDGMLRELEKAQHVGKIVKIKPAVNLDNDKTDENKRKTISNSNSNIPKTSIAQATSEKTKTTQISDEKTVG